MSIYISSPNLPQSEVDLIVCGTDDESILNFFKDKGISVVKNQKNNLIDTSVADHADMAAFHIGGNQVLIDKKQEELRRKLEDEGFIVHCTDDEIKGEYPGDISLNFAVVGDKIIGNSKYADKKLVEFNRDKIFIDVKQGYSKCSVLIVNENAVITDDKSIHRKITKKGIDSLLISKGDIALVGHEYGFIGGASGKIAENEVVFFGDIRKHKDYCAIDDFIRKYNCNYVLTDSLPLRDIGGIIPLKEKQHN